MLDNFFLYWASVHNCLSPRKSPFEKEEHNMTDDRSFNTYLVVVFVITLVVLVTVYGIQTLAV